MCGTINLDETGGARCGRSLAGSPSAPARIQQIGAPHIWFLVGTDAYTDQG